MSSLTQEEQLKLLQDLEIEMMADMYNRYVLQHKSYASFFIDFFKGCWRTYLKQTEKYANHHIYLI